VTVIGLDQVGGADAGQVGSKAANLGELKKAGLSVPDGFVVLDEPGADLELALAALGGGSVAVRSSAVAEDLADASFAGQYETYLNVRGSEQVRIAVRHCRESASSGRVKSYRAERAAGARDQVAVLVQRMVDADAAGVAFTANPVTGDRDEVVISAVRGLGDRLVSGEGSADEWVVRADKPSRRRAAEHAIDAGQAVAVADLARRAAAHFGRPQDVEWALAGDKLFLLQSRPMTALPASVEWVPPDMHGLHPPGPGYWIRNLRLGEWLPEPVTPLFADWMLELINRGFARGTRADSGLAAGLRYAIVHGWYYSTPEPDLQAASLLTGLLVHPILLFRFATAIVKQPSDPELAERRFFGRVVKRWREQTLPSYRALVAECSNQLESTPLAGVPEIIERLGEAAGEAFWGLTIGGGSAWKIEVALARFYRDHLASRVEIDVRVLLAGLPATEAAETSHAVLSADWYWPTLGESGRAAPTAVLHERQRQLEETRALAEVACRNALAGEPELRHRFDILLLLAQRYAQLREEQAAWLTLAWPLLRRCVLRLAGEAAARSVIGKPEDAFFLTRHELIRAASESNGEDLRDLVRARRSEWSRSRHLVAPLALGLMPKLLRRVVDSMEVLRSTRPTPEGALRGEPASPGRASGPVRVVRGLEDFENFHRGEILVAQATAPAWTPLFAQAAAVVTDGGSLAAHASLVAREYGIPAVVATGDATVRLADGQWVTVDGSAGLIEVGP